MYLLITIDTEGDNSWAGKGYENFTKNARFLPRFQELCDVFGYKPTYLATYEMAKDEFFWEFAGDVLSRNGCEIGVHPHPWNSPPPYQLTRDDMKLHPYLIEYPENIIREKVKVLTEFLEERFGTKMRSHRAGRWGFNEVYARILVQLGYKVDCSVTPFVSWKSSMGAPDKDGGPDFRGFPTESYFLGEEDISRPGNSSLLEVPMSIVPNYGRVRSAIYYNLIPQRSKIGHFLFQEIFGPPVMWFRPLRRRFGDLMGVAKRKISDNSNHIMFMLHSSELMGGCNPQFRNEREIDKLYEVIHEVFEWLSRKGVKAATCWEFYNAFVAGRK